MRALIAALSLPFAQPSGVVLTTPGDVVVDSRAIVQVICVTPNKRPGYVDITAGTAFRVGAMLLSVNHVTSSRGRCSVDGRPMHVIYKSPTSDFSMLSGGDGPFIPVDCGGFVKGRKYLALGYARGRPTLAKIELTSTGVTDQGEAQLEGLLSVIPGMSGGVILDEETGKAVGVVNAQDFEDGLSWSVPLSETPVCALA